MSKQHFPEGWDEARVQRLINHYETMSDDEMIAEDQAAHKAGKNNLPLPAGAPKVNGSVRTKGTRRPNKGKQQKAISKRPKVKGATGKIGRVRGKSTSKG
jgi:hypothetical protein